MRCWYQRGTGARGRSRGGGGCGWRFRRRSCRRRMRICRSRRGLRRPLRRCDGATVRLAWGVAAVWLAGWLGGCGWWHRSRDFGDILGLYALITRDSIIERRPEKIKNKNRKEWVILISRCSSYVVVRHTCLCDAVMQQPTKSSLTPSKTTTCPNNDTKVAIPLSQSRPESAPVIQTV